MYTFFLTLHNLLRWLVVIFALLAIIRAFIGLAQKKDWTKADERAGLLYTIFMDTQVLVGIILYFFLSPITKGALSNLGGGMSNAGVRFFAIEHFGLMLVALALAHVGRSLSKKAADPAGKFRRAALWFTLSFLVMLAAIPWPFYSYGRPLLRFFGITL